MAQKTAPIKVSIQLSQSHATWQESRSAWIEAESIGADAIYNCDHFFPTAGDPEGLFLEAWTSLAAFAEITDRAQIGVLVTGNSYRNPNLLADIARTVDHVSGGRVILGIGSGWCELDYREYGYEFGTPASRLRDLKRDLPIIRARLDKLNPGPVNGHMPILIGGSGVKVTLRLVAEHADMWHCNGDLETVTAKSAVLDEWCAKIGRDPATIERSASVPADKLERADAYVAAGFTNIFIVRGGPQFDLGPLRELVAWRDGKNAA